MSDQIILEFIGDPSGLRPAEEALKGLSKTSQDTIEAFAKANEAAKKFAGSAKEVATSLKGIEDSAGKGVKVISSLTSVISGGAIKSIIDDFKKWSAEVTTLTTRKQALTDQLNKVSNEIKKLNGTSGEGTQHFKKLSKEAEILEGKIGRTNNALAEHAAKLNATSTSVQSAGEAASTGEKKITGFAASIQKGASSLGNIVSFSKEFASSVGSMGEAIALSEGKERQALEIKKKTVEALDVLTKMQSALSKVQEASHQKETIQATLATVANNLRITSLRNYIAAKLSSIGLITQGVSAEAAETTATTAGTVASRARYTTLVLENGANSQSAVVRTLATGTQWALNAAMYAFPIVAIVAGVIALGAALVGSIKWLREHTSVFDTLGKVIQSTIDTLRDYLSILTGGLVDSSAVVKHKDELKAVGELHKKNSDELQKQIDLMEAQGASAERIAARKRQQLTEERDALKLQFQLEDDIEKKKEIQNKLHENEIALIKNKKEVTDAHIETLKQQGASELQILQYKRDQTAEEIKLNQAAIMQLRLQLQSFQNISYFADTIKKTIKELQSINDVLADKQKQQNKDIASEQQRLIKEAADKRHEDALKELEDQKAIADKNLIIAQEENNNILESKITALDAAAKVEIENARDNEARIGLIEEKLKQDKAKAIDEFTKNNNAHFLKRLEDEKTGIEAKLVLVKKGSDEEYKYRKELYDKERQLINANAKLSTNERTKALNEITKEEDHFREEEIQHIRDLDKTELESKIKVNQEKLKDDRLNAEEKAKIQDEIIDYQRQLQIDEINATITDEKVKAAKIREINDNIIKDQKQKQEDARKDKEQKDNEAAKKQEDLAKQIGKALIEIAQKVSDAIFENEKQKRDNDLKEHLDSLNAQKDAELLNTTLTTSQRRAIEKKYKIEEAQEKEKAWKADQKAKAEQAIINGLLALTMSLAQQGYPAGLITGLIALASAGVQAGIIMSKTPPKFAKGVVSLAGPGTETSDSIHAMLSKGESVITAKATREYAPMLNAMNAGTFHEYMPIPQMPDVSRHAEAARTNLHSAIEKLDYEKLGEAFAKKVNLKQLNINIDEKGFTKSLLSKGSRIESYNDKMKF